MSADAEIVYPVKLRHPEVATLGEAINADQVAHWANLGWTVVEPDQPDEPAETVHDTADGLGDTLQLATPDGSAAEDPRITVIDPHEAAPASDTPTTGEET